MKFDLISMKIRSKSIMKKFSPKVYVIALFVAVIDILGLILGNGLIGLNLRLFFVCYFIAVILREIIEIGYIKYAIIAAREKEGSFKDLFSGFTRNMVKNLISVLLKQIIIWIGLIFFIIPGVIAFYRFRFLYFDLNTENKSLGTCIKESVELTKGHCIELFKIDLSFIGWYLLNAITLGIASIYVRPLTTITYAEYYDYLKAQQILAKRQ